MEDYEYKELTAAQKRKLKRIAKSIDELLEDVQKVFPCASIVTLDGGGISIYDGSFINGINYGDMGELWSESCRLSGGSF